MLYGPWQITLLGTLAARNEFHSVTRFRTRQTSLLLACLAYFPERPQSREELADRLWPDEAPDAARTNLRVALCSLRRQMEPPGMVNGGVLMADRNSIRLRPQSFTTDVSAFQAALYSPLGEESLSARARRLGQAVMLYTGELLPGVYDEWVLRARETLAAQYRRTLGQLLETEEALGNEDSVRECAARLISADPLEETGYLALMRLAVGAGESALAQREFERLERLLARELGVAPSEEAQKLLEEAMASLSAPRSFQKPAVVSAALLSLATPRLEAVKPLRVLPPSWTQFFGREAEQEALLSLLTDGRTRLVTLTGPGGAGKTRLAAELGRRLADTFPGPVCFVPLADIVSASLLPGAIAASLRMTDVGAAAPLDQIVETLGGGEALLLLDNLEQVAEGAAPIVQSLLARLPRLRCLVTSRRPLNISGERVFPLPPLSTPLHPESPERLLTYAGVQLFVDRAQAVRPDFQITPRNAEAISALCDRLEGLPLALELAAAWTGVLTPAQALARLDERFALLVSRTSEGVKRHRTMHAAIAWSFDLLPSDLRRFFLRLSVFRGGWTAEAAEAVCEQPGVLEALGRLRERSLIIAEDVDGGTSIRFRMLESLREFADDQCDEKEAAETLPRHAAFFLEMAEAKQTQLQGAGAKECLDLIDAERANILAALDWFAQPTQEPLSGLRLACALWRFWSVRGPLAEGQEWLTRMLARTSALNSATEEEARAYNGLGVLFRVQGDKAQARALNQKALDIWRRLGDTRGIAASLNNIGGGMIETGEYEAALPLLEESLGLWRALEKPIAVAQLLQNLGFLACERGDFTYFSSLCAESLALFRSVGDRQGTSNILSIQALAASKQGHFSQALLLAAESIRISVDLGCPRDVIYTLETMAEAACGIHEAPISAALLGASDTLRLSLGEDEEDSRVAKILTDLRLMESETAIQSALALGRSLTPEQAVALALEKTGEALHDCQFTAVASA